MSKSSLSSLLPAGFADTLPPDAAHEAFVLETLIETFSFNGYQRVKLPLLEFEDSLFSGTGVEMTEQTFRLMDPISQKMMGVRADMTPQIARVATTRLAEDPRPLRLCYGGQVLRVKGDQLRSKRQFTQAGVELIGAKSPAADAEVILMAVSALSKLEIHEVSVDLGLPSLIPELVKECALNKSTVEDLRIALDRKDSAEVLNISKSAGSKAASIFPALLNSAGEAELTLKTLKKLNLGDKGNKQRDRLQQVVNLVNSNAPNIGLTIDPVENRSFKYHAGVTFSFYTRGVQGELGSGGRYIAGNKIDGEQATGLTLFMDTVINAAPPQPRKKRIFIPLETSKIRMQELHHMGWITVSAIEENTDLKSEALRLNCDSYLNSQGIKDTKT